MHRIDTEGSVSGLFSNGSPPSVPATVVDADILNAFQEEIASAIEADGTPLSKADTRQLAGALGHLHTAAAPGGRLTLSASPVGDGTSTPAVIYAPYRSNRLALWNGSRWVPYVLSPLVQMTTDATKSPAACVANANYDVFVWVDGVQLRATRGPAWASDTSRGSGAGTSELGLVSGQYVNAHDIVNGPAAQRGLYVGTIRTDASAQAVDTPAQRFLWNRFNRVSRPLRCLADAGSAWATELVLGQAAGGGTLFGGLTAQVDMVRGLDEDSVNVRVRAQFRGATGGVFGQLAIGLDSASAAAAGCIYDVVQTAGTANDPRPAAAEWSGAPGLGRHRLVWLDYQSGAGASWVGQGNTGTGPNVQSGMSGECFA